MNIFILDNDRRTSVQYQFDRHVVKMPLETAQLLSTAHRVLDGENAPSDIYKISHMNHPCAVWARQTEGNYLWLAVYLSCQLEEYTYRYGKHHKSGNLMNKLCNPPKNITPSNMTPFPQCMPDQYKNADPVEAYRAYYIGEKQVLAKWKNRPVPSWWKTL